MENKELGKRIALEGTINTRSLEGYMAKDGRRIKKNRIFRSDALTKITESDKEYFKSIPLRVDIDLRGTDEIERNPDIRIDGCEYFHCPIEGSLQTTLPKVYPHPDFHIEDKDINGTVDYIFRLDPNGDATHSFENNYRNFISLPHAQEHYSLLLRKIKDNKEGAVLFHCMDGKDRCGTGVMLFLSVLGIDRETIIEDYLKTNEYTKQKADSREKYLREVCHMDNETVINSVKLLAGVRENFIRAAFDEIDSKYNGFDSYVRNQLHFTDEMIKEIQDNYLE